MNKGPEYPKVSFLVPRPQLDKAHAFAARQGMSVSEAFRFLIDLGLETLSTVEKIGDMEDRANLTAARTPATRGKFPRPTGGHDGSPAE